MGYPSCFEELFIKSCGKLLVQYYQSNADGLCCQESDSKSSVDNFKKGVQTFDKTKNTVAEIL